jgi:hypothetical protein
MQWLLFKKVDGSPLNGSIRHGVQKKEAHLEQINMNDARNWFTERHAAYLQKREDLIAVQAALETKLEEAKAEVIKSAWKWKKVVGEPAPIRKVKAEMATVAATLEAFEFDPDNLRLVATMEAYWAWDKEEAEMELWRNGGPPPAFVLRERERELAQFFEECEVLPIVKTY